MKKWLKEFVHNVIVHPLMMFLPKDLSHRMHDKNAAWAFGLNKYDELKLETHPLDQSKYKSGFLFYFSDLNKDERLRGKVFWVPGRLNAGHKDNYPKISLRAIEHAEAIMCCFNGTRLKERSSLGIDILEQAHKVTLSNNIVVMGMNL